LNLQGQTIWYASPVVADLGGDGKNELIAAYYSIRVFASDGSLLSRADGGGSRVYAPHVVVDLEGDGISEIVYGSGHEVYAYEWRNGGLRLKAGWPADTTTAGESPEVRGLAAADLDGDGLSNDYERMWGLNPTNGGSRSPVISSPDKTGTFTYTRRTQALTGLQYTVWVSTDLQDWFQISSIKIFILLNPVNPV